MWLKAIIFGTLASFSSAYFHDPSELQVVVTSVHESRTEEIAFYMNLSIPFIELGRMMIVGKQGQILKDTEITSPDVSYFTYYYKQTYLVKTGVPYKRAILDAVKSCRNFKFVARESLASELLQTGKCEVLAIVFHSDGSKWAHGCYELRANWMEENAEVLSRLQFNELAWPGASGLHVHLSNSEECIHCWNPERHYQDSDVFDMLTHGIRALDITIMPHYNVTSACTPEDTSSRLGRGQTFDKLLTDVLRFVETYTKEIVLLIIKPCESTNEKEVYARIHDILGDLVSIRTNDSKVLARKKFGHLSNKRVYILNARREFSLSPDQYVYTTVSPNTFDQCKDDYQKYAQELLSDTKDTDAKYPIVKLMKMQLFELGRNNGSCNRLISKYKIMMHTLVSLEPTFHSRLRIVMTRFVRSTAITEFLIRINKMRASDEDFRKTWDHVP